MYRIGETEHEQEEFKRQLCYNFHFEWGRFEKKTYISNENKFHFQMPTLLPASLVISSHTGFTFLSFEVQEAPTHCLKNACQTGGMWRGDVGQMQH